MHFDFEAGEILLVNKPLHWTSFDVVYKIRGVIREKLRKKNIKIGHAGTLDPLATGLLILCTGKFTKRIEEFQDFEKEYTGTITLGATTPCFDLEKPIDAHFPTNHITDELIYSTAKKFVGITDQIPPMFSAIQIDGKRVYKLARKGEIVEMKARQVNITNFEIPKIEMPNVDFRVVCSKGTYIRSLARDMGEALNSGAHLSALCRTRIGEYKLENAYEIEDLKKQILSDNE